MPLLHPRPIDWGLRDYKTPPQVWGGDPACVHEWSSDSLAVIDNSDKRRWNHAVNGRGEEQPDEKKLVRKSGEISRGRSCRCGAWRGSLGLESTPEMYVAHLVEIFREARRVLQKDGTLWLNLGDCYAGAGHGNSGKRTSTLTNGGEWQNKRGITSLAKIMPGFKPKDLIGIPWRVAFALQGDGWYLRSDIIWSKPNPMPESVTDRPTRAHEYLFLLAKSVRYYYDAEAIKEPLASSSILRLQQPTFDQQTGGPRDYANDVNPNRSLRRALVNLKGRVMPTQVADVPSQRARLTGRNKRSVWEIPTQPYSDAHFATFPKKLVEPCILAGCPRKGIVLDPFCGSGTALLVAQRLGRHGIGIELSEDYCRLARARVEPEHAQQRLPSLEP